MVLRRNRGGGALRNAKIVCYKIRTIANLSQWAGPRFIRDEGARL